MLPSPQARKALGVVALPAEPRSHAGLWGCALPPRLGSLRVWARSAKEPHARTRQRTESGG